VLAVKSKTSFGGLGAGMKAPGARMLGASKSSELRPVQAMRMIVVTARKKVSPV